jgi:hypothetical protein
MALRSQRSRAPLPRLVAVALLASSNSVVMPVRADTAPTQAELAKAKRELDRGQKLYKQGKLDEAYTAFQESHDAVADPKASLMMARIQRDRGELLKAHSTYEAALREAQDAEASGKSRRATADEIKRELGELSNVLGWLTIEVPHAPSGTRVSIDGRDVTSQMGKPIRVEPGPMVVEATVPGGVAKSENVTVKAGETASIEIKFSAWSDSDAALAQEPEATPKHADDEQKADKSSGESRAPMWIAGGVGVAGFATFAIFGILSNSKYKDLDEHCPDGHCYPDYQDIGDQGKTFQTVANIGLVVGAVGVATAATLFVIGPSKAKPAEEARLPKLRVGLGSVALSGSFQ